MKTTTPNRARQGAIPSPISNNQQPSDRFLNTAQAAHELRMSESFLTKGRIYGYGPPFIRLRPDSKGGAIRYRFSAIMRWLEERQCNPEEAHHG